MSARDALTERKDRAVMKERQNFQWRVDFMPARALTHHRGKAAVRIHVAVIDLQRIRDGKMESLKNASKRIAHAMAGPGTIVLKEKTIRRPETGHIAFEFLIVETERDHIQDIPPGVPQEIRQMDEGSRARRINCRCQTHTPLELTGWHRDESRRRIVGNCVNCGMRHGFDDLDLHQCNVFERGSVLVIDWNQPVPMDDEPVDTGIIPTRGMGRFAEAVERFSEDFERTGLTMDEAQRALQRLSDATNGRPRPDDDEGPENEPQELKSPPDKSSVTIKIKTGKRKLILED